MRHTKFFHVIAVLAVASLSAISLQAKAGADHFKVYLNNKLVFEQYVNKTMNLQLLQLDKANMNDNLTFHYSHCGEIGKDRKIALTDGKGNIVREWKFADVSGKQAGMVIPVKELLKYQQSNLQFMYSAQQLPKGQLIAGLQVKDQRTGWIPAAAAWFAAVMLSGWNVIG